MKSTKFTVNYNMGISKYLFSLWIAVLVYTLFSFMSGPKGLSAYTQLSYERDQQLANLEELRHINEELDRTRNNLLFDHDTQIVHARRLGYAHEDERFIRIVGLGNIRDVPAVSGDVYTIKEPDFVSDRIIKIAAFAVALLLFCLLFALEVIDTKVR